MRDERLLSLLGYDVRLAAALSPRHCAQLRSVVTGWLCALFLVAWPIGHVVWLTEHSTLLATLTFLGVFLLCLNLLRVAVAGGGAGAGFSASEVAQWRPGLVPSVFLCVLACLVAQPAHLLFTQQEHAALVAARRAELLTIHTTFSEVRGATGSDSLTASLETCEFVVYRLQLLWNSPSDAARFTALYGLLVLVPVFWTRYVALDSLRAYEHLRYQQAVRLKLLTDIETARDVAAALTRFGVAATSHGGAPPTKHVWAPLCITAALSAPRRVLRTQPILKWRAWS